MTNSIPSRLTICLGSEAPSDRIVPTSAVSPAAYAAPAQFLDLPQPEDLAMLSQIAAELLPDPLAVQQLSERVFELLQQDLRQQRERSYGYRRRW
ncbi:hypothetical protein [Trichocoleus sp. FACHB-262]|uniref:hypothetical protein n=1 Tax=Trichocoleus sp. FACHB-262 TaxID=2692869 RepID=UPI0016823135|nr:hypothetical protein [Trichocoleus sp. FACHB-262]MBD2123530.1 hypothetical protein [Trichocoleus sp. FACHB-262]